jgi:cell division protein FtsI (penicillin-binding protein 3)
MKKQGSRVRVPSAMPPASPGLTDRRLATPGEQALARAHNRLILVGVVFLLAYTAIAGKLTKLTVLTNGPELASSHAVQEDAQTARADIVDRNGTVLATSLPTQSLCADTHDIHDTTGLIRQLQPVLPDLDSDRVEQAMRGVTHCAIIRRHLTPHQAYEISQLGITGLEFRDDERRVYPAGEITSHVVGYTDIDNNGLGGIERQFDERLQQETKPLQLALDIRVQTIMHRELEKAKTDFNAEGAAGLVMDIGTGEILSMVSLPDFDPLHPSDAQDKAHLNRDTMGVYEMGSTFKIFNTALALDSGAVKLGDSFDTSHPLELKGHQTIRDYHPEKRWLNVTEIMAHSSNIGAARMAERIGGARQRAFFANLGLTEKAKIELPEIGTPMLPDAEDWSETTTMTTAFGHGIAVNAVQLAGAVATIINDGLTVRPTLIKKTADANTPADPVVTRVISPETAAQMRALMRLVVTRGTAKEAEVHGYLTGGKTGTADKLNSDHKYSENARLSSFIGAFPINAPKYLVFAMVDNPQGTTASKGFATGGWVAAPVFSRVVAQIGPMLGVEPMTPDQEMAAARQVLRPAEDQSIDGQPVKEGSHYASVETHRLQ